MAPVCAPLSPTPALGIAPFAAAASLGAGGKDIVWLTLLLPASLSLSG